MAEVSNRPLRRRRRAVQRRQREARLLDAFADLRRRDRRVHYALVAIIRHGDVRILDAVGVIVDFVFRAAWRKARQGGNQQASTPSGPR
jgi:hypothetical protein